MIFIDSRTGSNDLKPLIKGSLLVTLESGDVMFCGDGPEGGVSIGVERKNINDLISSIASGRLSGYQIPKMLETYDVSYLVVEGIWKADKTNGQLLISKTGGRTFIPVMHGRQRWSVEGICHYLTTLESMCGIRIRTTKGARDTATMIGYLYSWWNKPWSKHQSHLALHKDARMRYTPRVINSLEPVAMERPSLLRKIAAELPGISLTRSQAVAGYFTSVRGMFEATEEEWRKIPGSGKATARMWFVELHK